VSLSFILTVILPAIEVLNLTSNHNEQVPSVSYCYCAVHFNFYKALVSQIERTSSWF